MTFTKPTDPTPGVTLEQIVAALFPGNPNAVPPLPAATITSPEPAIHALTARTVEAIRTYVIAVAEGVVDHDEAIQTLQGALEGKADDANLANLVTGTQLQQALSTRATQADITAAVDALKAGAPAAYDTLAEVAGELARGATAETALMNAIGARYARPAGGIPPTDLDRAALVVDPVVIGAFLPRWAANTAYSTGALVLAPTGETVRAKTNFTSGATYAATNWDVAAGLSSGGTSDASVEALVKDPASATRAALSGAFLPRWAANTAYAAGAVVLAPTGQTVRAKTAFTSTGTYVAGNWDVTAGLGSGGATAIDTGYDVILLAGQSNMSGRGGTPDTVNLDPLDPRVWQYGNSSSNSNKIIAAIEPLLSHDGGSLGPGTTFGRWWATTLTPGRRVLLVNVAHGGTSFGTGTLGWSVGGGLYTNAISQVLGALTAGGPGSRITAILWHQGESSGDQNVTGAAMTTSLDSIIDGWRSAFGDPNLPFIVGQMVPESLVEGTRDQINRVHLTTPTRKARTAVAYAPFGLYSGDHFSGPGVRLLGKSFWDAYARIANGVPEPAAPDAPAAIPAPTASALTDTSVTLTWTSTARAERYRLERLTAGTWSVVAVTADLTATATGLTAATEYSFRVRPLGPGGPGAFSPLTTVTTTNAPDTSAPTVPGTPTATAGPATASATTSGSTDNVAVSGYRWRRNGTTLVTGQTGTTLSESGLPAGTPVYYTVAAFDAAGNESAPSAASNSVTPTTNSDVQAPTTPGTPTATAGAGSASATTSGSTDNVGVTAYRWWRNGTTLVTGQGGATMSDAGQAAGTPVYYSVSAVDAAGNESPKSASSNTVTPTAPAVSAFVSDTFTDTNGVVLTSHVGEVGATWTKPASPYTGASPIIANGRIRANGNHVLAYPSADPASANYSVEADYVVRSLITGALTALVLRLDPVANTFYALRFASSSSTFIIQRFVNATSSSGTTLATSAAFTVAADGVLRVKFAITGSTMTVTVDGTQALTATDATITAAGKPGIFLNGSSTDTTGVHLDNFAAINA